MTLKDQNAIILDELIRIFVKTLSIILDDF
jgi:hypothetical protein